MNFLLSHLLSPRCQVSGVKRQKEHGAWRIGPGVQNLKYSRVGHRADQNLAGTVARPTYSSFQSFLTPDT